MQSTVACGLLMFCLIMILTAGGASPLATQHAKIGPYQLLLSYYSLPRAGQALSMTIESSTPGVTVQFAQAALNPAPGTDAKTVNVTLTPNSDAEGEGWFFRVELDDTDAFEALMDHAAYDEYLETLD